MLSLLAVALAASAVVASPAPQPEDLSPRADFGFCSQTGVQIAEQVILALGGLAGTQYCYSLLNVPQTTTTVTVAATAVSRTTTVVTNLLATTTTKSIVVTVPTITTAGPALATVNIVTYTIDAGGPAKRQATANGVRPGNRPAVTGVANSQACSCILGANPTQTLTHTATTTGTTVSTITSTTNLFGVPAVVLTTTLTTSTLTVPLPVATALSDVHFQRYYYAPNGGFTYTGAPVACTSDDCCLETCATQGALCQFVFIQHITVAGVDTVQCIYSPSVYNSGSVTPSLVVNSAKGYQKDGTVTNTKKKRGEEEKL